MFGSRVYKLINSRKQKTIFGVCLIEISKVKIYPPLLVVLLHKHLVGNLLEVDGFPNEAILS